MKQWKVVLSEPAEADIDGIYAYIADTLLEPTTAWRQIERINNAILTLDRMPERFPVYAEEPWHSLGVRRLLVDNYSVFFLLHGASDTVSVVAVMYSRRNISDVLQESV